MDRPVTSRRNGNRPGPPPAPAARGRAAASFAGEPALPSAGDDNGATDRGPAGPPGADTKRRLLAAAVECFADKGFANTSVRELTQRADVNLASVNYHFGGKLGLYTEMFRQNLAALREQRTRRLDAAAAEPDATLESVVRAFCEGFIDPLMEDGRGRLLMQLYSREMQEPLLPPTMFFEELIDPMRRLMHRTLPAHCPGLDQRDLEYCLLSLVGQLLHALQMSQHLDRIGGTTFEGFDMASTIDHIVEFSVAGIRHLATQR